MQHVEIDRPAPLREATQANVEVFAHRTGRLTAQDLLAKVPNTAETLPWRQPTEQQHIGATFKDHAPCALCRQGRAVCKCEIQPGSFDAYGASVMAAMSTSRLVAIGFAIVFGAVLVSHLFSGGAA